MRNAILFSCCQDCLMEYPKYNLKCFEEKYLNSLWIVLLSVLGAMRWSNPYNSASSLLTFRLNNDYLSQRKFAARACGFVSKSIVSYNCRTSFIQLSKFQIFFIHIFNTISPLLKTKYICRACIFLFCFSENIHLRFAWILESLR